MADILKAEVEVDLNGKTFILRGSIKCLCDIEAELGTNMPVLFKRLTVLDPLSGTADVGVREIVCILYHALKHGGHKISRDEVADIVSCYGIPCMIQFVQRFIIASMDTEQGRRTLGKELQESLTKILENTLGEKS